MTKIKHIDFSWSERIEEGVCDEVQTVLDKADGTPPIVEYPNGLDFEIGGKANQVGPGISDNDNPEELLDTIDMNHMRILDIEPAGFQALEHRFNGPSFLVGREGFLRAAEGNENLWLRLSGLVLDDSTGQVAELSADTIDTTFCARFGSSAPTSSGRGGGGGRNPGDVLGGTGLSKACPALFFARWNVFLGEML